MSSDILLFSFFYKFIGLRTTFLFLIDYLKLLGLFCERNESIV